MLHLRYPPSPLIRVIAVKYKPFLLRFNSMQKIAAIFEKQNIFPGKDVRISFTKKLIPPSSSFLSNLYMFE